jgi:hypothetical protein
VGDAGGIRFGAGSWFSENAGSKSGSRGSMKRKKRCKSALFLAVETDVQECTESNLSEN